MKNKLLLFGGGGHCRSVIDTLLLLNKYDEIGIVDENNTISVPGIPVVGEDKDLAELVSKGWNKGFITVGSIGDTTVRRKLYKLIREVGLTIPVIIDPSAIVSNDSLIGEGTYIGKRSVLNAGSSIGCCAIVNTGAIIEHDCTIGDFAHVSSGSILCGGVSVGADSHIGAGSVVRQGIFVGRDVLIGAGSVVVKNIPDGTKAYGNPCRLIQ